MSINPKCLVWNVRGLNSLAKRTAVFQVVSVVNPTIVCLQETKLCTCDAATIAQCLRRNFDFFYLAASGTRGGILLGWQPAIVSLSNRHFSDHSLSARVSSSEGDWWLTGVYGPHRVAEKPAFLQELREVHDLLVGPRYTWSNERENPTLERLDRVFVSIVWETSRPNVFLSAISTTTSDHAPLLLELNANIRFGRRFQFEAHWVKAPGFLEVVSNAWNALPLIANPFRRASVDRSFALNLEFLGVERHDLSGLEGEFSEEEVWKVV
ncbi:hypothetical protein BRADI_2g34935v3 [Brachypodium distachyon]|uniref:Endonuclease/exonuclease/phosphatase domain-containing protein n=1 Tax=Brachypodium distachyon TaxID=15368 RepID=A0A2K2DBU3_BRADI|nr:hypothetical protein BRADI_2g34935v3 [Brachypodium distachyon]